MSESPVKSWVRVGKKHTLVMVGRNKLKKGDGVQEPRQQPSPVVRDKNDRQAE